MSFFGGKTQYQQRQTNALAVSLRCHTHTSTAAVVWTATR